MFYSKKLFFLVVALFVCSCTHIQTNQRGLDSVGSCALDAVHPPLFNVIENNQTQIIVDLGDFAEAFNLSQNSYNYKIYFRGSKENKDEVDQVVQNGESVQKLTRVTVPVKKTGVYFFVIFENEKTPVWKQKVFAIASTEHQLSDAEKKELAEKYAPVVSQHPDELYFPVSLDYLTNQVEVDSELAKEPFRLTDNKAVKSFFKPKLNLDFKFPFSDLDKILPYYGHSESVLKSGLSSSALTRLKSRYGKNHITVYYSVFENPKWKEIYINYHFFYSYDPKNGTVDNDVMAAHIFDRESMTVVLRSTSKMPLAVFYGAHLASQTMGQLDINGKALQKWNSGRVFVNWPEVNKIKTHPIPAVALGSHAIYPKQGQYAVFLNNFKLLVEPAGGTRVLYPEFMTDLKLTPTTYSYRLQDLKLDHVTSSCDNPQALLAFSGSTVDVLGPANATFPPYTDREEDYFSYADPNAPLFDMTK